MTIRNPRSRTISIRLSEAEYAALKRLCLVTGARSLSDITRDSMRFLGGPSRDDVVGLRMDEFRTSLKIVEGKVDELLSQLREHGLEN